MLELGGGWEGRPMGGGGGGGAPLRYEYDENDNINSRKLTSSLEVVAVVVVRQLQEAVVAHYM